jgi:hypothetical protein
MGGITTKDSYQLERQTTFWDFQNDVMVRDHIPLSFFSL